ncbi:hypothetical protein [Sphingomonas soli]|uniref:hypothetical protein n=1 Tax=Sphingomonas soli TaxID=266127 RepID=UPI000836F226|nr:hypothetical protein [Sphingomonas soli]
MRGLILGTMILGVAAGQAVAQEAPRGPLFISPMGEPFRGPAPHDQWFDGADANHDGVLSMEEMIADAERFFATLDVRKDGEIDPQDVERYETEVVPEIRMRPPRERQGYRVGDSMVGPRGGEGGPKQVSTRKREEPKKGAARFSYLDYPQPITVADRNFNRGVDIREFVRAAEARFALLDKNGDGKIPKSELPAFTPSR